MEELNKFKAENYWLRGGLVLLVLIYLSSISVINRGIISERQTLTDSLNYFKKIAVSTTNQQDSLQSKIEFLEDQNGKLEMVIEEAKIGSPRMMIGILKNTEGLSYEK